MLSLNNTVVFGFKDLANRVLAIDRIHSAQSDCDIPSLVSAESFWALEIPFWATEFASITGRIINNEQRGGAEVGQTNEMDQ